MKRTFKNYIFKSIATLLTFLMVFYLFPLSCFGDTVLVEDSSTKEVSSIKEKLPVVEVYDLRTEKVKHFRLEDGTYIAAQYEVPVHYLDENGKWTDIDNTLTEEEIKSLSDFSGYTAENKAKVKFAKNTNSSKTFSIKYGDYKLSFGLIDANKSKVAVITNPAATANAAQGYDDLSNLSKVVSKVKYTDAYDNIDIEYILIGNDIKENIIVKSGGQNAYSFSYEMKLNNLDAVLNDNGSITLFDSKNNQDVFTIPAPYMYDANGNYSNSVSYSLFKKGNKYTFTISANADWINSSNRVFPITIDPTLSYCSSGSGLLGVSVMSGRPDNTFAGSMNIIGYSSTATFGNLRTYIKPTSFPDIPQGAVITAADISMKLDSYYGSVNGFEIAAYAVTGSWTCSEYGSGTNVPNSITWSTQPTFNSKVIDLKKITSAFVNSYIKWDITQVAKQWQGGILGCNGIMLKLRNENLTSNEYAYFHNAYSSQSANLMPVMSISYAELKGVESYYSYYESSVSAAGTALINAFNGNLTFLHNSLTTTDEIMPFTMGFAYNNSVYGIDHNLGSANVPYSVSNIGKGFKLFTDETIMEKTIGSNFYYIWNDMDGTDHYFSYNSTYGAYCDEDGLQLTITKNSDGGYTISDDVGNKKNFNSSGLLVSIFDSFGNYRFFNRNSSGYIVSISLKPKGNSAIPQLSFSFNSYNKIKTITASQTGTTAQLYYSNSYNGETSQENSGFLRKIEYIYSDTSKYTVTFDYDEEGRLILVKDLNTKVAAYFEYDAYGRIVKVHQFVNVTANDSFADLVANITVNGITEPYPIVGIIYETHETTLRTAGSDDVYGTTDDVYNVDKFDRLGRPVTSYSVINGIVQGIQSVEYDDSNVKTKNKIRKTSNATGSAGNGFTNPNMNMSEEIMGWYITEGDGMFRGGSINGADGDFCTLFIDSADNVYESTLMAAQLLGEGKYTFSVELNMFSVSDDAEVVLYVMDDAGNIIGENVVAPYYASGSVWVRKSVSFTTYYYTEYYFYIALRYKDGYGDQASSLDIDSAMLNYGNGALTYNMIENSSFDTLDAYNGSQGVTYGIGFIGDSSLEFRSILSNEYYTITLPQDYQDAQYSVEFGEEIELPKQTYVFGGWGKCDSVSTGYPNTNGYSNFMVQITINYLNTSFKSIYYIPFNDKVSDWQYISGAIETEPDPNGFRHYVTSIEIKLLHQNNPSVAYVDEISLIKASNAVMYYEYNSMGYCTRELCSDGTETVYTYLANGIDVAAVETADAVAEYTYASGSHVPSSVSNVKTVGSESRGSITEYTYDSFGNVTKQNVESVFDSTTIEASTKSYWTVNSCFGKISKSTDMLGNETYYYYDSKARLLGTTGNNDYGVLYSYNDFGQLIGAVPAEITDDGLVALNAAELVNYRYNGKMLLTEVESNSTFYNFGYNKYGQMIYSAIQDQSILQYRYQNGYGKLTTEIYGNNFSVHYLYDGFDNLSGICYNGVETVAFSFRYNDAGVITEKIDHTNNAKYYYTYDGSGRVLQEQMLLDGENYYIVNNEFDNRGRLTSSYRYYDDALSAPLSYTQYTYDEFGTVKSITMSGMDCRYTYDSLGRVTTKKLQSTYGSASLFEQEYNYKQWGNFAALEGTADAANDGTQLTLLGYNDDNRNITRIVRFQNGTAFIYSGYIYDEYNRLKLELFRNENKEADLSYIYLYTFDENGNRTSKEVYTYPGDCTIDAIGFTYNGDPVCAGYYLDIVSAEDYYYNHTTFGDALTSVTTTTYNGDGEDDNVTETKTFTYDSIGNMLTYGSDNYVMEWNGKQLANFTEHDWSNGHSYTSTDYFYNENGIRIGKQQGSSSQVYSLDGDKIMRMAYYNGEILAADVRFYYDASGAPTKMRVMDISSTGTSVEGDYTFYLVINPLGDIINILDSNGNRIVEYAYDAFGNAQIRNIANTTQSQLAIDYNPFRYRGYFYDTESGFYYLNSRYYAPELGRFISMDDFAYLASDGNLANANLYVYCNNNPVMLKDDSGNYVSTITGALIGAIIGGISSAMTGDNVWAGIGIGCLTGGISGFAVDIGIATGGAVGLLIAGVGGGISSGFNYWATEEINGRNIDYGTLAIEMGVGAAFNMLSFGTSNLAGTQRNGSVWRNFLDDGTQQLFENTQRRIHGELVKKSTHGIAKNVTQNAVFALAMTGIISTASFTSSKIIQYNVRFS